MRYFFTLSFALIFPFASFAQTNAEKLEQAVKIYNSLRDYEDDLKPGKVGDENISYIKAEMAKAKPLLDEVVNNGTSTESTTARYFRANFSYELGFVYGMMGRNQSAYDVLNPIKSDFEYYSQESIFPLKYIFDGKNYSIKYENFAPTLGEYYTGMAEICANLSKNEEAISWAKKSYNFSYSSDWYKYIAVNKIIEVKKKQEQWDAEMLEMALNQLNLYGALDTSYKRTVKENNYPSQLSSYKTINSTLEKHPELSKGGYYWAEAAPKFAALNDNGRASEYFEKAIDAGYSGYGFIDNALAHAHKTNDNSLGQKACAVKEKSISNADCNGWRTMSSEWESFGNKSKADEAKSKARACDRKDEKERRRRERNLGMYVGIYPGPLLIRYNHYRDYGGVVGFGFRGVTIEGSYKMIKLNHVVYDDMMFKDVNTDDYKAYWNGYRAHLAFKFHPKNADEGFYVGPLFEIVSREYTQTQTQVFNAATNTFVVYRSFVPKEKSMNLYLNYGMQQEQKHFMIDMFLGLGASYNQYDPGIAEYGDSQYTFDNPVLQNRKANRFGFMIRMGLTLGLSTKK